MGNLIKGLGMLLLVLGLEPALAYFVVGIGAVVYSPAKYGILPELTQNEDELLRANAKLEGFTIMAILAGTVAGGFLADVSITWGIITCVLLYLVSLFATFLITKKEGNKHIRYKESALEFFKDVKVLFQHSKTNFSLIGTGAFWMASAVLRIAFLVWLATYLGITEKSQQSMIVGITAVGIVFGSLATPYLVPIKKFYNSYIYGFLMAAIILVSIIPIHVVVTGIMLLIIGFLGGVFIVPMNSVLQDEGKKMIGSGKTIAIQNFVENVLMLVGIGVFKLLLASGFEVKYAIACIGILLGIFVFYLKLKVHAIKMGR